MYAKTKKPNIKRAFDSLADGIGTRNKRYLCPNVRPQYSKALEETRVSYYDKVTQGNDAIFVIKYPLEGTTYIISDNLGLRIAIRILLQDWSLLILMQER